MAYYFYLGGLLLPIPPAKLELKVNNQNKTFNLINFDEVNVLRSAGLTDINFEILLPQVKYPFAAYRYTDDFRPADIYIEKLENLKQRRKPFWFKVIRTLENGTMLFGTDMKVSLEDYKIVEDAKNGFDVTVSINLKQYKKYGTKKYKPIKDFLIRPIKNERPVLKFPEFPERPRTYVVKRGDCLQEIAKKCYGDISQYKKIAQANHIINPILIYPGQILRIPI